LHFCRRGTWQSSAFETYTSTSLVVIPNTGLVNPTGGLNPGTWAQQGTTAFKVKIWVWGALDEPIPANDNDLIERMAA
jgi:hypothetical protein